MIGGRVLDTSAPLAFARGTSLHAAAAVWTAVAAAWAELAEEHRPVLDVSLHLPVTVIDNLDQARARALGQLGGPQADAHAIARAHERGWPPLTAHPDQYARYDQAGVDLEPPPQRESGRNQAGAGAAPIDAAHRRHHGRGRGGDQHRRPPRRRAAVHTSRPQFFSLSER